MSSQAFKLLTKLGHSSRSLMWAGVLLCLAAFPTGSVTGADSAGTDATAIGQARWPGGELPSANGQRLDLAKLRGEQATILVTLSLECPISNGYLPTLNRLAEEGEKQGFRVVGINPNDGAGLSEIEAHHAEYKIAFPVLKDAGGHVAEKVGATHCPQALVFDADGVLRYRGRIDDRYQRRGGAAGTTRQNDLQQALEAVLANKEITVTETEVVGCPILWPEDPAASENSASVTYAEHVAPLFQKACVNCHRDGGVGPFALTEYEDAKSWATDIAEFTRKRLMPPWKPVAGFGDFHNARALSDTEIDTIQRWVRAGAPAGDLSRVPPLEVKAATWSLGQPDLVVSPAEEFTLAADGPDEYRCFVIPTNFDEDKYVAAIEVLPGNPRVVHHVIAFLDNSSRSTQLDNHDPGPGYQTSAGFPGFLPSGGLGGWAPGNMPHSLPEGMAKVLPKGAKIVLQVHYHRTGKEEKDRTQLGIYFAKPPVTRAVRAIIVMPFGGRFSGMKIPAGADNHEVRAAVTLPREVLAVTVTPHMHLLGKDMTVTATLPDGTVQPLVKIENWDFNWQETYQYREPVRLPAGTHIELVAHFDNSEKNPANPHQPPQTVYWGEQTSEEMCIAFLDVVLAAPPHDGVVRAPSAGIVLRDAIHRHLLNLIRGKPKQVEH